MSNKLEIIGVLYKDMGTQRVTDKMEKREFVIETTDEQYPQLIKFELVNDKCKLLDRFKANDKIKVAFNLKGREWKKDENTPAAYFVNVQAWGVFAATENAETEQKATPPPAISNTQKATIPVSGDSDDLPF